MSNYTKEQEAIRQSFANFLGALMTNSMYENELAKENAIAVLCEELVKYIQNENNTIDVQLSKPILKSSLWTLQKRKEDMLKDLEKINIEGIDVINNTSQYTKDIDFLINSLNDYIKKIGG